MPNHVGKKSMNTSLKDYHTPNKSTHKDRYQISQDQNISYLEPEKDTVPNSEQKLSTNAPEETAPNTPQGKSKDKLEPKIGRIMSDININQPKKDVNTDDFLHVLVDQVIAEVANEMNLHNKGCPLIYPVLAQTNMASKQVSRGRNESAPNSYTYEAPSDSSIENNLNTQKSPPRIRKDHSPLKVSVKLVEDESTTDTALPSSSDTEDDHYQVNQLETSFCEQLKRTLQSHAFWCIVCCILLTLYLLYVTMIFGAYLALAICSPYNSCIQSQQSSNPFLWNFLHIFHPREQAMELHGLF